MQGEIALNNTERKYIGLSHLLREVILIMNALKESSEKSFIEKHKAPTIYCELLEDNTGAIEIARNHKWRPRAKHLHIKLHNF